MSHHVPEYLFMLICMVKEVPEVALEFFEPEGEECTSDGTDRALNLTRSGVPLDDTQVYSYPYGKLYFVVCDFLNDL
jgi:hypothetical protein